MYKSQHIHHFNRCSFENRLTISVIHPQTLKFYYCYPHLLDLDPGLGLTNQITIKPFKILRNRSTQSHLYKQQSGISILLLYVLKQHGHEFISQIKSHLFWTIYQIMDPGVTFFL